jgi:hypothetical protein
MIQTCELVSNYKFWNVVLLLLIARERERDGERLTTEFSEVGKKRNMS